jgi:hypothetical protein
VSVIYINSYQFAAPAGPTDPYFANVSLLLHGDGTNGSTNIIDSSYNPKTITVAGNAQISTAQSKFGGSSIAFDGNGDYLSIPDNDDWDISGDYTVEFWARMPSQSTVNYTIGYFGTTAIGGASGFALGHYQSTTILSLNGSITQSSAVLLTNTWQHIALVISGASAKVYVDGVSVISTTSATTTTSTSFIVGNFGDLDANRYFNGYIDDLRITRGISRYNSSFTPPTQPFPNF